MKERLKCLRLESSAIMGHLAPIEKNMLLKILQFDQYASNHLAESSQGGRNINGL